MGEAALERAPEVVQVSLSLPNKHHLLADLSPFGFQNDNEIFVPTDEPYGLIEATVRRG
jgi:urate oxidase